MKTTRQVPMSAVKSAHSGHWFSPDAMRFFGTKLPRHATAVIVDGATVATFFVTSELPPRSTTRVYTVRKQDAWGEIETVSDFAKLTRDDAIQIMKFRIDAI